MTDEADALRAEMTADAAADDEFFYTHIWPNIQSWFQVPDEDDDDFNFVEVVTRVAESMEAIMSSIEPEEIEEETQ